MCHIFAHVKPIFVTGLKGTSMGKTKKAGKTADAAPEKIGLLQAMEQVVKLSSRSELEDKFFAEAGSYIDIVSKKLDMTPGQALMFCIFIDQSDDSRIRMRDLANHFSCRTISVLRYSSDIDELEKRKLIRCSGLSGDKCYKVPKEVVESIKKERPYTPKDMKGISCDELFEALDDLLTQKTDDEISEQSLQEEITYLFEVNPQLDFVKKVMSYDLPDKERLLLIFFCHLFVRDSDDCIGFHDFNNLFEHKSDFRRQKSALERMDHPLFKEGLIENAGSGGLGDRSSFKLTDMAKTGLLSELDINIRNAKEDKNLLKYSSLAPKRMFYNASEQKQVDTLTSLLMQENFSCIQTRLKENGMRTGFACLFHGGPGTGKTETVYQIARLTERNILQVNVSEIKSMWVGESEKNIKALFDRYRSLVEKEEKAPILFFNEADAIIGKRQEGAERAVEKMENSIQNIILQEMENLTGIMIATTNLTQNMDKAFERRFLYKILFDKPSVEARQSIWESMLPDISKEEARMLAMQYGFSGGQIENISRKRSVEKILYGENGNGLERLKELCDNESIIKTDKQRKIGF